MTREEATAIMDGIEKIVAEVKKEEDFPNDEDLVMLTEDLEKAARAFRDYCEL